MAKSKRNKPSDNTIAQNKRARFDYQLLQSFEAGVSLAGWEVKSLRAGKVQLTDSYVLMKAGEAFSAGCQHHATGYSLNPLRIGPHTHPQVTAAKERTGANQCGSHPKRSDLCVYRFVLEGTLGQGTHRLGTG